MKTALQDIALQENCTAGKLHCQKSMLPKPTSAQTRRETYTEMKPLI